MMTAASGDPVVAYFDGLCMPYNPGGYACGGWYIVPHRRTPSLAAGVAGKRCYCEGSGATNNIAEYSAALDALRDIYRSGYRGDVLLYGDSQLVIRQFSGEYKCKKPELRNLRDQLRLGASFFASVQMIWVPREKNRVADGLSEEAYREARAKTGSRGAERPRVAALAGAGEARR